MLEISKDPFGDIRVADGDSMVSALSEAEKRLDSLIKGVQKHQKLSLREMWLLLSASVAIHNALEHIKNKAD